MKAVFLDGAGGLSVREAPMPEPRPGEALIRVLRAGICGTDLELRLGYKSFHGIPGHEFVGIVEEARSASSLVGKRVVGEINVGCLACATCADGLEVHCPERTVVGILGRPGAFAEYLALPTRNLHEVPPTLETDRAVFTEPTAAAFEIVEQIPVAGREALVLGAGRLGTLCAGVLTIEGATVHLQGRDPDGDKRRYDLVVEATGNPQGIEEAMRRVKPRGTIVLKSTCAGSAPIDLSPIVVDEITVVGSRCGPFAPALEALERGDLRPEETIDARFPLDEAEEAFRRAEASGVRKVLFVAT